MAYRTREKLTCDVLIIGAGIAGALLAYELGSRKLDVILACKSELIDSNTAQAQGGLAAVTGTNPLDKPLLHWQDTIAAGGGITDERIARSIIEEGGQLARRLAELGVEFDRNEAGLDVALEGGHSRARILHSKDASGRAIALSLTKAVRNHPHIRVLENTFALDLIMNDGRCLGANFLVEQRFLSIQARHTVMATGGLGQIFSRTTNPAVATGDGIAMAYRAGAKLADLEFIQFHPTALAREGAPASLISEAVRGAGAQLLDKDGQRFAFRFHKDGELATRDVVARAIYATMMEQKLPSVWLDLRPIGSSNIETKFPNIIRTCWSWGIDPAREPVPVSPAAHYFMGGIWVDEQARSSIPGLFAIGECACTGLHGANRLASNSLLEGGVMALRLARILSENNMPQISAATNAEMTPVLQAPLAVLKQLNRFKSSMFEKVGLERSAQQLQSLISSLPASLEYKVPAERTSAESANIALLGWLIARSALERKESRGAHWRLDYPDTDQSAYRKRLCVAKEGLSWCDIASQSNSLSTQPLERLARTAAAF